MLRVRRWRPYESSRVSVVAAPAVVSEVPRPLQAGLGAGRSYLRLPPITEPHKRTHPWPHRLRRRHRVPLNYRRAKRLAKQALGKHAGEPEEGGLARWKHVVIQCYRHHEGLNRITNARVMISTPWSAVSSSVFWVNAALSEGVGRC